MTLWRLEGDTLPVESRGQVVPEYYGRLHRDIPGYPLQVGAAATLADNCGATATDTTLRLSGPALDRIRDALVLPVVAQLEDEWVRVTAVLGGTGPSDPWRIVVGRGYGGTAAAVHAKGVTVNFLESRCVYVFASAPDGCRYPDGAVIQVRINDVAQTPPCTIRLQDARWIPGARLVTAEFDLTRYFGGARTPTLPTATGLTTARAPARAAAAPGAVAVASPPPVATRRDFLVQLTAPSGHERAIGWAPPAAPPPAPPPPPPLARTAPALTAPTEPAAVLRLLPPLLGRVTMDLRGLLDTPAGRYTGTPSAPLLDPISQVRCILESTYGATEIHEPSWAATRAALATDPPVTTCIAWQGEAFETFRSGAGFHAGGDLWLDDDGQWRYTVADPTLRPTVTVTPREIIGEVALGVIPPSATSLVVTWLDGMFTLDRLAMQPRSGVLTERALALPWAETEAVARRLGDTWARRWEADRWTATVAVAPCLAALSRTDRVWLETPLLTPYGLGQRPWEIRGTVDRGDQRVLTLVECDDVFSALAGQAVARATVTAVLQPTTLAGQGAAAATASASLTLLAQTVLGGAGTGAATLGGTVLVGVRLAGPISGAGTATGTLTLPVPTPTLGTWITKGATSTSAPVTQSYTTGAGETYLLVQIGTAQLNSGDGHVTSVTFGATGLTRLAEVNAFRKHAELWGGTVPASTTATVTATFANNWNATLAIVSVAGVTRVGAVKTQTQAGATTTASVTFDVGDQGAGTLGVDFLAQHFTDTAGAPGQTAGYASVQDGASQTKQRGSAATNLPTMTWTGIGHGNADSIQIAVPLVG